MKQPGAYRMPYDRSALVIVCHAIGVAIILSISCLPTHASEHTNPFPIEKSCLPIQTYECGIVDAGTDHPIPIDAERARQILRKVFREEGFNLQTDYEYERDGVAFIADGYDPVHRIGFVLATYKNLDDDAAIPWWQGDRRGRQPLAPSMQFLLPECGQRLSVPGPPRHDPNYAKWLQDWELQKREYEACEASLKEEEKRIADLLALRKEIENWYAHEDIADELLAQVPEIHKMEDLPRATEAFRLLKARAAANRDAAIAIKATKLSLAEATSLQDRAVRDKEFILVISQYDTRLKYSPLDPYRQQALQSAIRVLEELTSQYIHYARESGLQ